MTRRVLICLTLSTTLFTAACGNDEAATGPSTSGSASAVEADAPFPDDRCAANRAAGTITYLSGFDFAAAASIVEVLVADERGYFEELCLDVEVRASFTTQNYPEIAAGKAHFASGGSFSEMVDYAIANDAPFVAVAVEGKTGIDTLIVKDGAAASLEDLRGTTIGVKGKITPSVAAMLLEAGLREGEDYETVLLDGFDPTAHIAVPNIVGFPGYKSNEPNQLRAAGVEFDLFDPADVGIPGSFGVLVANGDWVAANPTAAEDFMRAAMRGLADAVADPQAAADIAVGYINANGNAMFLSPDGERARWAVDARIVADTNSRTALGVPELDMLEAEVRAYAAIGLFSGSAPEIETYVDTGPIARVYASDKTVIWPAS
jgi:NitT/TauT family transport system substrate-binding protein